MKWWAIASALTVCAMGAVALDRVFPPDLSRYRAASLLLLDDEDRLLDGRVSSDGAWRIPTRSADIDPGYVTLLLRTEDHRFADHPGIDPFALARAAYQLAVRWRIVSGGSTLAMQTARLLSPHPHDVAGKISDLVRALQLEARYGRVGMLDIYLTLAPEGGNVEGIRAASLLYFGHEPQHLTLQEAALLVAIPRRPGALRPDRHPDAAIAAAARVLDRSGVVWGGDTHLIRRRLVSHDAQALLGREWRLGRRGVVRTTIDGGLQRTARRIIQSMVPPPRGEFAALVTRRDRTAAIWIGGAGPAGDCPGCSVDMVTARRSPGSTLKPFAYGMAFDQGTLTPDTILRDERMGFSGYTPRNYDRLFHGGTTATVALQQSYNLPAVQVLRLVGPARFVSTLASCGVHLVLPRGTNAPGLPVILGGAAISMLDLASLYGALAGNGLVEPVRVEPGPAGIARPVMGPRAARQIVAILRGTPPPPGVTDWRSRGVAFKTGTSYGQRDAWAAGATPGWTVVAWAGRPDGTASPGITGRETAAPLMARLLDVLTLADGRIAEAGAPVERLGGLSPALQRLGQDDRPRILAPSPGSSIEGSGDGGRMQPVGLEASGGTPPYRWIVDGLPVVVLPGGTANWLPDGPGFAHLAVIDANGRSGAANVRVR